MKLILEIDLQDDDVKNPDLVVSAIRHWATRSIAMGRLIEADLYPYKNGGVIIERGIVGKVRFTNARHDPN